MIRPRFGLLTLILNLKVNIRASKLSKSIIWPKNKFETEIQWKRYIYNMIRLDNKIKDCKNRKVDEK